MTSKRQFGTLRKLSSGRWQARYRDASGLRHAADDTFASKSEAARWLALAEADVVRGDWIDPRLGRVTFAEWAAEWLSTTVHLRAQTRAGYDAVLRTHLLPVFESRPIATIEQIDMRRFVANMLVDGAAPGTVRGARKVARLVFAAAIGSGALRANPCDGVKVPRSDHEEMVFLDPLQIEELADAIAAPYGVLIRLAAYSGMRAGEIGALRVGRLDLLRGRIEIVESLAEEPGRGLVFGPPKTYQRRSVTLPRFLCDELGAHLRDRPHDPEALVFSAPEGGPLNHRNFYRRQFRDAVVAGGLPARLRFHDLRHTCAALLVGQSAHPLVVMKRLGHSSITVTMNTYGHMFPALEESVTDGLDRAWRTAHDEKDAARGARVGHDDPHKRGVVVPIGAGS